jgi:amino-acid N-acetyltransferase
MNPITLTPAIPADREAVNALLVEANLPNQDFADHLAHFWVARQHDQVIGAIGLEPYGPAGLLRSLVVKPTYRDQGVGQKLADKILAYAQQLGVQEVYLLTTTAADFFPKLGFSRCQRADAPPTVQATTEFASLCPVTAVCMVKKLS